MFVARDCRKLKFESEKKKHNYFKLLIYFISLMSGGYINIRVMRFLNLPSNRVIEIYSWPGPKLFPAFCRQSSF